MDNKSFFDLFEESIERPRNIAETGVTENTILDYVSYTYLNGILNYTEVFQALFIERYNEMTPERKPIVEKMIDNLEEAYHTDYGDLDDDVVLLAESENDYWYFYYDKDVSDCSVGRVNKENITKEEFITLHEQLLVKLGRNFHPLPLPKGWVKG